MARIVPVLLSLALLLGGCIGSTDDPAATQDPAPIPAATGDAPDASASAPAPSASSSSSSNGTAPSSSTGGSATNRTASNGTAPGPAPPAPPAPRSEEVKGHGAVTLKLGAPCDAPDPVPCQPGHDAEPVNLTLPQAGPATAMLTLTWTATSKATESLRFDVAGPDGAPLGSGEGTSPVAVTLPPDVLRGVAEVVVTVVPPTPGAVVAQEFDLLLALTY